MIGFVEGGDGIHATADKNDNFGFHDFSPFGAGWGESAFF